jgi:hypothetical protein
MTTIATKFQMGAAASAIAVAAALLPAAAQAQPAIPAPQQLGGALDQACIPVLSSSCILFGLADLTGPLLHNPLVWIGTSNPTPPTTLLGPFVFPLPFIGSWFAGNEICLGGATLQGAPYGNVAASFTIGC